MAEQAQDTHAMAVDLARSKKHRDYVMVLVKHTYRIEGARCVLDKAEPLLFDYRAEDQEPRLSPGTDYWPRKDATDVVVQGLAFAPGGRPVPQMSVGVEVGAVSKWGRVFGTRRITWTRGGHPKIGQPEPFASMPLVLANAYGGVDWRVAVTEEDPDMANIMAMFHDTDHPGLYPRNPFGKGYFVDPDPLPEAEMPNIEDPDDLLTEERLVVHDPRNWWRQPLPWTFDWTPATTFPRYALSLPGVDAWYPGPEDEELPEVRRGFLSAGLRTAMNSRPEDECPHPAFFQEASHGLVIPDMRGDELVRLVGMHPEEPDYSFRLPGHTPRIRVSIAGTVTEPQPRLHSIVCLPDQKRVTVLHGADVETRQRFVPGVHAHIPISAQIDDHEPMEITQLPTMRDMVREASDEKEMEVWPWSKLPDL